MAVRQHRTGERNRARSYEIARHRVCVHVLLQALVGRAQRAESLVGRVLLDVLEQLDDGIERLVGGREVRGTVGDAGLSIGVREHVLGTRAHRPRRSHELALGFVRRLGGALVDMVARLCLGTNRG